VEIVFSPRCNLGCTYCYVKKYYSEAFPDHLFDTERSIRNVRRILEWLAVEGFRCNVNIFSGELFAQAAGYELLDMMAGFYIGLPADKRPRVVTVPTNFTFLCGVAYRNAVKG